MIFAERPRRSTLGLSSISLASHVPHRTTFFAITFWRLCKWTKTSLTTFNISFVVTTGHWKEQETGEKVNSWANVFSEVLWQNKRLFHGIIAFIVSTQDDIEKLLVKHDFHPLTTFELIRCSEVSLYIDFVIFYQNFDYFLSSVLMLTNQLFVFSSCIKNEMKLKREAKMQSRLFLPNLSRRKLKWVSNDDVRVRQNYES